jgi:hypothetical protein
MEMPVSFGERPGREAGGVGPEQRFRRMPSCRHMCQVDEVGDNGRTGRGEVINLDVVARKKRKPWIEEVRTNGEKVVVRLIKIPTRYAKIRTAKRMGRLSPLRLVVTRTRECSDQGLSTGEGARKTHKDTGQLCHEVSIND